MAKNIGVYVDWEGLPAPLRLGILHAQRARNAEIFDFEFDEAALSHHAVANLQLDPRIGLFRGRQYPPQGSETFGVFADASPDRWGRLLMRRRLEREKRAGRVRQEARLQESDFLLGVHDSYRVGALRFRLDDQGDFLDNRADVAAPPFVDLRKLEAASRALERDDKDDDDDVDEWLRILIAPGGSLGGARPKASVVDPNGDMWIAKFPSDRDEHDVGAWELVVHSLARRCGVNVPSGIAQQFASLHHTFLVKRFDRTSTGQRLHFASAMTLTNHDDGDDASNGASYLEIARVLMDHGAQPDVDLRQLWLRILFNVLVSNTDDHLRNHGFILVPDKGWRLSEAYDMNPVPDSKGLRLNISEADNTLDLDLVFSVAPYFRVSPPTAKETIEHCQSIVRNWKTVAAELKLSSREQEQMSAAFRLAE